MPRVFHLSIVYIFITLTHKKSITITFM